MSDKELAELIREFVKDCYPPTEYHNRPTIDEQIQQAGYDALNYFAMWIEDRRNPDA